MKQHKFTAYSLPKEVKLTPFVDKNSQKGVFVYTFGTVVFWNFTGEEIAKTIGNNCISLTSDDFILELSDDAEPKVEFNKLILNTYKLERVEAIAQIIGQSVTLEYFEKIVDKLKCASKISFNSWRLSNFIKKMDEVIEINENITFTLKLLEKPDITWNDSTLDELYGDLRQVFDFPERFSVLENKLNKIEKRLNLRINLASNHRSFILELLIVLFFAIEIIPVIFDWLFYFKELLLK